MEFLSELQAEIAKYDKYKPFPASARLNEAKNVVDVNRFLEVTCQQHLDGIARATIELEQFENALLYKE